MNELKYFWGATTTGSCLLSAKPLQVNTVYLAFTCVQLPACGWTAEWGEWRQKSLTFFHWGSTVRQVTRASVPPQVRISSEGGKPGEGADEHHLGSRSWLARMGSDTRLLRLPWLSGLCYWALMTLFPKVIVSRMVRSRTLENDATWALVRSHLPFLIRLCLIWDRF